MINKVLRASRLQTVRISSDLCPLSPLTVSPVAALRIFDHDLHSTKLVPSSINSGKWQSDFGVTLPSMSSPMCTDSFCAVQSVRTFPFAPSSSPLDLAHYILKHESASSPPFKSTTHVRSVGSSSIQFSHSLSTVSGKLLAVCSRTFVRVLRKGARPAKFTEAEALVLSQGVTLDKDAEFGVHLPLVDASRLQLPKPEELRDLPFAEHFVVSNHLNFGGHVSHCALTEIVMSGKERVMSGKERVGLGDSAESKNHNQVTMHYVSQGMLNDVLKCYVKLEGERVTVYAVKEAVDGDKIVCVGEFKP